jgi:hypothetical protein
MGKGLGWALSSGHIRLVGFAFGAVVVVPPLVFDAAAFLFAAAFLAAGVLLGLIAVWCRAVTKLERSWVVDCGRDDHG